MMTKDWVKCMDCGITAEYTGVDHIWHAEENGFLCDDCFTDSWANDINGNPTVEYCGGCTTSDEQKCSKCQ